VKSRGRWGFMDREGRIAISPIWDEERNFSEGTGTGDER